MSEQQIPADQLPPDAPLPVPYQPPPPGCLSIKGKFFAPVVFGQGKIHRLSQREMKALERYLETGSEQAAAQEIGVSPATIRAYLKRKHVQAYVTDMLRRHAFANGMTIQNLLGKLAQCIEGELTLTPTQLEACKAAARILKPSVPGSVVNNVQVNNSVYNGMSAEELTAALQERAEAAKEIFTVRPDAV